jgi:glycine dehydrogenase subunit 1
MQAPFIHPYIPNFAPEVMKTMMQEIGISDIEELFKDFPVSDPNR